MLKKYLKIILVLGLIFSGVIGQVGFSNIKAIDEKTNLSFESSKKNYLEIENEFDYMPKTIEIIIKFDQPNNQRNLILGNYVYLKNCLGIELNTANQLRYVEFVYEGSNAVTSVDYKVDINDLFDNQWHNIAFVRDVVNNQILLYIDGTLRDTLDLNGTTVLKDNVPLESPHFVGTDARKSFFLDADIHEIRLWDTVRTADEINQNQDAVLTGKEVGLTGNWVFDLSKLDTLNIIVPNKVANQPGFKAVGFELPKGRTFLDFESAKKSYVEITEVLEKAPKTIDFWAKLDKNPNKRQLIFSNYVYGSNGMGVEITADNQLRYVEFGYTNGTLTGSLDIRTSGEEICNNEWTHFAIVRDFENGAVKMYKNGVELVNKKVTNTGTDRLTEDLTFNRQHYIGTDFRGANTYYLDGEVDGFSLWDSSKTEAEVKELIDAEVTGKEADLLHSWDFDFNSLSMSNPYIKDKKENGISALATNFDLNVNEKSILYGKSALFVGDSITNAVKDPKKPYYGWAGRIGTANSMDWNNAGISSATISTALETSYPENRVINQLIDNKDKAYDYVILHGGMNDSIAMTEIGEMNDSFNLADFDTKTFSGAMDELIYTAKELYPNAIIGYIVNYATPNSTWGGYSSDNSAYFDRAKEICEKWEIPYIDLYDGGIEVDGEFKSYSYDILEVTSGKNMYDGLSTEIHIGSKGYDIISPYIQKWMEEISRYSNVGTDFSKGDIEVEMVEAFEEIPLTFEAWIKMPETAASGRGGVIAGNLFDAYCHDIQIMNFEIGERGVPRLYSSVENNTYDYKATGVNVCTNQWTHVAISYDQENNKAATYINGEKVHEVTMNIELKKLNQPMKIGKDSRDAYNFKGEIADLRIWSTTRTAEEIQSNFKKEINDEQGLLGSWKLDGDVDGKYLDSSKNQNHAQNYWIDGDFFPKSEDGYKSIAVIPDTQSLAIWAQSSFPVLTNWLKDNKEELGIELAIHVGDIVNERDSHSQWKVARDSFKALDGVIPYVLSPGNHDVEIQKIDGKWYGLRNTPLLNQYFPYSELSARPTFGGTFEEGRVDNTYSYFTINNVDFMVISLEESPRVEVLEWANKITEENKDKKVIVTTHEYLYHDGSLITNDTQDHLPFVGGSTTGEEMWDLFVRKHENITAVIAGHVGYPDVVSTKKVGDHGNTVTQILCDAQFMDRDDINNGSGKGLGMVMILSFKENSDEIKVNWYSTVREQFYREKNQYTDTMELTDKVNKEDLQMLYDECLKLNEADYTKDSWDNFEIAMNEAKVILDKADATQNEIDDAKAALKNTKKNLVKVVINSDKTALKIAIDLANAISNKDLENVVPVVVNEFKAARDEANAVYDDTNASQVEVNNAFDRLASAMHMLDFVKGDKTALKAFIDKVSELEADKYTKDTWIAFETELDEATAVYNDENAMQEEVNNAYKELVTAFLNLRLIPNKDLLGDLINQAEGLNSANYTKASFDGLTKALNEAKVVLDNPNATQEEVDNAKATLEKAINGLETNTLTPVEDTVKTPVNNSDTTTSVKTGDESLTGMFVTITLLSIAGYAVLRREN
ncbi:LamG-like jellyroll fold domain-containing protein [Thomasclavelia spiroformis]|uniref:LamG-like jellyroll fold domain-containing protein n=1 Tax=Thomasclavelia spiroformis TaxID=29348 RepID=UPI00241F78BC|nr:LamG-like jellyroll fold domain-containing protein [Thomasclavelia spiroformis]